MRKSFIGLLAVTALLSTGCGDPNVPGTITLIDGTRVQCAHMVLRYRNDIAKCDGVSYQTYLKAEGGVTY